MIICHAGVQELYKDWDVELPPYAFTGVIVSELICCAHIYLCSETVVQDLRGTS